MLYLLLLSLVAISFMQVHALTTPQEQFDSGVPIHEIQCIAGKTLVESAGKKPACVYPDTAARLEERGWRLIATFSHTISPIPDISEPVLAPETNPGQGSHSGTATRYHVDSTALRHQEEIHNAFVAWRQSNPDFEFERVYSIRDSTLMIFSDESQNEEVYEKLGSHSGYYKHPDAEIHYILGDFDCNGFYVIHSDDTIRDIITHEIGHHLGLEHTSDEDHLMYGANGTDPALFDEMGYVMPARQADANIFAGQAKLHGKIAAIDSELEDLLVIIDEGREKYDAMNDKFSEYPDVFYDDFVYAEASALYYKMLDLQQEINENVDEYNALLDERNDAADAFNCYSEGRDAT